MSEKRSEHHDRMDELIERFGKMCHEELDKALICGAIDPDDYNPEEFILARLVLTCVEKNHHFEPFYPSYRKEIANLGHFIG